MLRESSQVDSVRVQGVTSGESGLAWGSPRSTEALASRKAGSLGLHVVPG